MPLAWIHNLPRDEAEKFASELGVSVQGTLDELQKRLKEKWRALKVCLPPQITDKFAASTDVAGPSAIKIQAGDVRAQSCYAQSKLRGNVVSELVTSISILTDTEPERVFRFLVRAKQVYDLKLVTDGEFLALLVARTAGKLMNIISGHLRLSSDWALVCSDILSQFLPPRVRESFLFKYVLDRFQGHREDLAQFITSVVNAAGILEYHVSESALVRRIVQNIHPSVRPWLTFESEPRSVEELYALTSHIAEARAVDQRRESLECCVPGGKVSRDERDRCPISMVMTESPRPRSREIRCYKCTRVGHIAKNCLSSNVPVVRRQGNGGRRSEVKDPLELRAPESERSAQRILPVKDGGHIPWVMLTIKNYCMPAILDSGSSFSFVRQDVFQQIQSLGLPCVIKEANHKINTASGHSRVIKEAVSLQLKIHSFSWKYDFLVFDNSPMPCILGLDFL
ncbi:hypothetical protein B7P43_G17179 [Cryptotermes secundus]|uniref:CCHC-type domain-containing protein n=1 Tax=Cryptotermes secundus TaxID=105785 RepID=A0A2J7Q3W2_9NEOP|nr:hypothetical protein B7P43_G17179 [Cryptotermes secundus]